MSVKWLFDPEKQLINELASNATPERLESYFASRTSRWKHSYIIDETGTWGTFGDLQLKPESAFQLIPTALDIALRQTDVDLFETAFGLLFTLTTLSNTTEMPQELHQKWKTLAKKVSEYPSNRHCQTSWQEFARWYRVRT